MNKRILFLLVAIAGAALGGLLIAKPVLSTHPQTDRAADRTANKTAGEQQQTEPEAQKISEALPQDAQSLTEAIKHRPIQTKELGYIASENCRKCHAHHFETWHASHHRTMTQVPTQASVIADFNNVTLSASGHLFRFFHEGDDYFMELKRRSAQGSQNPPKPRVFKIVLMTGAHHQQGFWCETGQSRTLAKIPFIWINKEMRWVPYGSIFFLPESGLSMHSGIWNSNCIKCHVVGGQPRHVDRETGFDTHVAEFGISCEACHGPGAAHADFHSLSPDTNVTDQMIDNAKMVNPADLSHQLSSQACGQCHSVFDFYDDQGKTEFIKGDGFAFRPGDDLFEKRHVFRFGQDEDLPIVKQKLKRDPKFWEHQFWSDGMVRVSGREYNGLLETACHQRGTMSCLSCHDMHPSENDKRPKRQWADDQMKQGMRGNQACLQCHAEFKSDENLTKHTFHTARSTGSNCYNCHMPHTTLGLMKAMRSHTIDSPNVATTVKTGRPNACNLCHLDKTLAWTADHLQRWYDIAPPELSKEEKEIASSIRWILKGDAGQRAIAGWHFGWEPAQKASQTQWMAPFLAELLTDSYDVVRFIGYHSLRALPEFSDWQYDFVGPTKARELSLEKVIEKWGRSERRPTPSRALLIDAQTMLMKKEFQTLRDQRLDPKMKLIE